MNDDTESLLAVVTRYRLTLPQARVGYDVLQWRHGKGAKGRIPSFDYAATLLCTNGVVAWFRLEDDTVFWGHLAAFVEDKGEGGGYAGPRRPSGKPRPKSKRQQLLDSI